MRPTFLSVLFILSGGQLSAQPDTAAAAAPASLQFRPVVRSLMGEASTLLVFFGSFGATFDLDLVDLPSRTIPKAGIRLSYQEFNRGFFLSRGESNNPTGYLRGIFLRGSHGKENVRSDAFAGVGWVESDGSNPERQFLFGVDIRVIILRPVSSLFIRVVGNRRGVAVFLGISIGYVD